MHKASAVYGRFPPFVNIQKVIIIIFHSARRSLTAAHIYTYTSNPGRGENPLGICLQRGKERYRRAAHHAAACRDWNRNFSLGKIKRHVFIYYYCTRLTLGAA